MESAEQAHDSERKAAGTFSGIRKLVARHKDVLQLVAHRVFPARRSEIYSPAAAAEAETDLDAIIEEKPARTLRITGYTIAAMFLILGIVSAVAEVDVIIHGNGELTMDSPPIVLQPMERAVIRSLKVKPGDVVTKGQVLATLDSTFAQADMSSLLAQKSAIGSQVRRLEAETSNQDFETSGSEPQDDIQRAIFEQRKAQFESRLLGFDEEIRRLQSTGQSFGHDAENLKQQLANAQEVEKMRSELNAMQHSSRLQLLETQNLRLRIERDYREAINRQEEAQHALASKRADRQSFVTEWRRADLVELDRLRTELARLNEVAAKAQRLRDLVDVVAPEDGVVLDIAGRSAGSVLREAEPLITVVAAKGSLIADVLIKSRDVGYIKVGDVARVKVDAFPYQRHGLLTGTLRSVSENSNTGSNPGIGIPDGPQLAKSSGEGAMHRARIELSSTVLENLPPGTRLFPGMTITADIKIGSRSILSYIFDPIRRGFDESLREPS